MDGQHFDELTRSLASGDTSRRRLVKGMLGAALAGVATALGLDEAAAACRLVGQRCSAAARCCANAVCNGQNVCRCKAGFRNCGGRCFDLTTNPKRCGSCTNACPTVANGVAVCRDGVCGFRCKVGFKKCNGACIPEDGCCEAADCPTFNNPCRSTICSNNACVSDPQPSTTPCAAAVCINPMTLQPARTCDGQGTCSPATTVSCGDGNPCTSSSCINDRCVHSPRPNGDPCTVNGASGTCQSGVCCPSGQTNCGGSCYSPGASCTTGYPGICSSGTLLCQNNSVVCVPGITPGSQSEVCNGVDDDCDGVVDDGAICPGIANGTSACLNGRCVVASCNAGWANCDNNPFNGCETNTNFSTLNCGGCGRVCSPPANASPICNNGNCDFQCNSGFHRCGNGCFPNNDPTHCGGTCLVCPVPTGGQATCTNGTCGAVCNDSSQTVCSNICVDTSSDRSNCGRCGNRCPTINCGPDLFSGCQDGACGCF